MTSDKKIKLANAELTELVASTGRRLQQPHGIGPSGTARLIGDIADVGRFTSRAHSRNGTAPIDASAGDQNRPRQSRAGARVPPIIARRPASQPHRSAATTGAATTEAMRTAALDVVHRQMATDAKRFQKGPGGHGGDSAIQRGRPNPKADTSEKSLPGPAEPQPSTSLVSIS